jgi:hypothetical protein
MTGFVVISDCLKHGTVGVHLFQSKLCSFFSCKLKHLTKIYYFSDGAALQYKNWKNCINLCYHYGYFFMDAECTSLYCHTAKVPVMGLVEQLKG